MRVGPETKAASVFDLGTAINAELWSGSFKGAFAQASLIAERALKLPDRYLRPDLVYLGRGLEQAQDLLRSDSQHLLREITNSIRASRAALDSGDPIASFHLRDAYMFAVPFVMLGVPLPRPDLATEITAIAEECHTLALEAARDAESEDESNARDPEDVDPEAVPVRIAADAARMIQRGLALWQDLRAGNPSAELTVFYDPQVTSELEDATAWSRYPASELIIAIDELRRLGVDPDLDGLQTLPPALKQRGGWWMPRPK